jgi:hypothetical protein
MGSGESDFASEQQSSEIAAVQFKIATRLRKLRFIVVSLDLIRSNWLSYYQLLTIPQQMQVRPGLVMSCGWARSTGSSQPQKDHERSIDSNLIGVSKLTQFFS